MERDDREMLEVTRDWRRTLRDWLRSTDPHIPVWQAFAAFVLLVLIAVFSLNAFLPGGIGDIIDGSSSGSGRGSDTGPGAVSAPEDQPPAEDAATDTVDEPAAEEEEPTVEEPAAPAHFVGSIVSDNGWFTITVAADGQASGTLTARESAGGDSSVSTGTFSGTIGANDVIDCSGPLSGTTYASNGQQWPFQGTITVHAVPTSEDRTVWQIDFAAEPGQAASLPAHAQ